MPAYQKPSFLTIPNSVVLVPSRLDVGMTNETVVVLDWRVQLESGTRELLEPLRLLSHPRGGLEQGSSAVHGPLRAYAEIAVRSDLRLVALDVRLFQVCLQREYRPVLATDLDDS